MSLSAKLRRAPLRAVTGAYILNSGIGKFGADDDAAKSLHGVACGTYPFLDKVQPKMFAKGLATAEIALGGALLLPVVPPLVAGAALATFSGALLNMYWHTPGMHQESSPRPTQQGVPIAKDVWMFGIGTGLVADALLSPAHDKHVELAATASEKRAEKSRRAKRKAAKAAKAGVAAGALQQAREAAREATRSLADDYETAVEKARHAGHAALDLADEYSTVAVEKAHHARQAAHDIAEHGSTAAEKAKQARARADRYGAVAAAKAKHARALADEYGGVAAAKAKQLRARADEYSSVAAEKAKQAQHAVQEAGAKAREHIPG